MYTCERLGENATEFKYAPVDGSARGGGGGGGGRASGTGGSGGGGTWARAAVTVAGASLLAQSLAAKGSPSFGVLGLALVLCCLVWSLGSRSRVREESLLVVRELGVQVTTKYVDGREKSTFLDKAKIKAILINEGITMHRVVFYLAFVVEGRDKMVVAFENLKPRLHILVKIYRGTRAAILGEAGEEPPDDEHERGGAGGSDSGAYGGVEGEPRGDVGMRRKDRIARRQARHTTAASAMGTGWPPPHVHNY